MGHAKEYGFVFPSSEIYDGLAAVYDYGPNGVELKNNLKRLWWQAMTQLHQNVVGLDAAIFMAPQTWQASGHVAGFNDPLVDNLDSKKRYRADVLLEDKAAEYEAAGQKERAADLLATMGRLLTDNDLAAVRALIVSEKITCPVSGTANWTDVRQFNLMYSTQGSVVEGEASQIYLRPETAQGIFVNFLNVQKSARQKVPFGIAQIGKAFRNEIVARQFIFRMREFEQMEMQFFVRPGTEEEYYEQWKQTRRRWHEALGLAPDKLRYHDHDKLAHYAKAAVDIEYEFPFGFKEIEGIHSRADFDLTQHQALSRRKQQYFDNDVDPADRQALRQLRALRGGDFRGRRPPVPGHALPGVHHRDHHRGRGRAAADQAAHPPPAAPGPGAGESRHLPAGAQGRNARESRADFQRPAL